MEINRQKNVATRVTFPIVDADGDTVTAATALDSESTTWADGSNPGAFADLTNEATEIGTSGVYYLILTAAEVNFDYVYIRIQTSTAGAKTQHLLINTRFAPLVNASGEVAVSALAAGSITAAVIATGAIDSDAIAADAITAAKIANGAIDAATFAAGAIDNAAFNVTETLTANPATGGIVAASFAAGAIDAAAIAADAIGSSELAASAVDEIVNAVWDELTAEARVAATYGQLLKDNLNATISSRSIPGDLMGLVADAITAAKIAANAIGASELAADAVDEIVNAVWDELTAEARVAATYGQLLKDNINATISSRSIPGDLMGLVASAITAAKFAAGAIDAAALAADAVDEIWDEVMVEPAQAIPGATPALRTVLAYLYTALRNAITVTSTTKAFSNDAGTVTFKKALSDDGTTYTEAEAVAGP